MGNCVSSNADDGNRSKENTLPQDGEREIGSWRNNERRRVLQSMARVGSRVFKPASVVGPNRAGLKEYKASTYDHVHDIVNLGIECYHVNNATVEGNGNNDGTRKLSGKVGLVNMGNTCFMNSSLQCLSNTIPLTDYFLGYDYRSEINLDNFLGTKGALVSSYAEVIKHLWLGSNPSFKPDEFKSNLELFAPQFEGYEQQDAQELLAFLLDGIHEDLNRVKNCPYIEDKDSDGTNDEGDAVLAWSNYLQRNMSIIVDLFQGQLRNTMVCRNDDQRQPDGSYGCGHRNVKFDPFMYLSLPISDECNTLEDCLNLFCQEELLSGDEKWYCPKCKTHVEATKKIDLWMLPPILIIHLKRFKFCSSGQRSKIDRSIQYPLNDWDLSSVKKSSAGVDPLYDLYAVSHHRGNVGFGHYTAQAKNRFDGKWYDFNDSQCHQIEPSKENLGSGPSAYCLFYNRVERVVENGNEAKRNTIIRRQSANRPELWPHLQRATVALWKSTRLEFDRPEMDE
mmetsp:Transcript_26518/g.55848  ORF Transcript_26518/g.55848 Transcript_26518/m.55848 type:complete len:508 (+) Transcript_26518:49-1572(+)